MVHEIQARYHRQDKLVQGIGSQLQGQLFRLDASLDVGSPTRLGCFCLTRPGFTTHVPKLILPGGGFHLGKNRWKVQFGTVGLDASISIIALVTSLWARIHGLWWKSVWRLWEPQDLRHFIFSPGLWQNGIQSDNQITNESGVTNCSFQFNHGESGLWDATSPRPDSQLLPFP